MRDSDALAFRARLGEYLEGFMGDLESEAGRRHFCDYVSGLLGSAERKNMERMAFKANVPIRTLQDFLACYTWDEDAVRRRVRRMVAERYADDNAIAIIDETGVPKKGEKTAGVQRQYCGARGKIENSVMFVGLAYVAGEFHTLLDLELYLPKAWAEDKTRRRVAGIPDEVEYRSKQDMSVAELRQAVAEGVRFRWATADEFYGRSSRWRREVAEQGIWYVVEVPKTTRGLLPDRIAALGPDAPDEAYVPREVRISTLGYVAFSRWRVERCFQDLKGEVGLDHFEVHKYRPLVRHLRLALAGMLFLAIERKRLRDDGPWLWSSKREILMRRPCSHPRRRLFVVAGKTGRPYTVAHVSGNVHVSLFMS